MRGFALICLVCLLSVLRLCAATLSNDTCSGATTIPAAGPFPHLTAMIADISSATLAGDPPPPGCASFGLTNSLWFKFTPAASGLYRISTCSDTGTTVDDTAIAIYRSSGSTCGTLTEVACSDDACGLRAAITNNLVSGRAYFIVVWKFALGASSGGSALQLRISRPTQPANDFCADAVTIPPAGPFPHLAAAADITLATTAGDPPALECQQEVSNSIWYKFKPAAAGIYRFSTCSEASTTVEDTVMGLYSASACDAIFTALACNDDTCGLQSSLSFPLTTNTTCYIVLWSYAQGAFLGSSEIQLRVSKVAPPAILSTSNYAGLTHATLQAAVAPNEGQTAAWLEWGTTTNYDRRTPTQALGAGGLSLSATETITGLTPGMSYHTRFVATNEAGIFTSPDSVIITAPPPRFTSYGILPDAIFRLRFTAPTNESYRILATTNLQHWLPIGVPDPVGPTLLQFDAPLSPESQFFRVVSP